MQVGEKRRRDGHKRRLAHAHQRVPHHQLRKVVRHRRQQCRRRPEQRPHAHDQAARIAVGQPARQRSGHHVAEEKRRGQQPELGIRAGKFALHQRLHGKQHRAVDVVHEVQRRQNHQRRRRPTPHLLLSAKRSASCSNSGYGKMVGPNSGRLPTSSSASAPPPASPARRADGTARAPRTTPAWRPSPRPPESGSPCFPGRFPGCGIR